MASLDATDAARQLLGSGDAALWGIVGVSLSVTLGGVLIAMPVGSAWLTLTRSRSGAATFRCTAARVQPDG